MAATTWCLPRRFAETYFALVPRVQCWECRELVHLALALEQWLEAERAGELVTGVTQTLPRETELPGYFRQSPVDIMAIISTKTAD